MSIAPDSRLGIFPASVNAADAEEILGDLDGTALEICVADNLIGSEDVQVAVSRGADLLARLFARVEIRAATKVQAPWVVAANTNRIYVGNGKAELLRTVSIGIGDVDAEIHVGMSGTTASISRSGPRSVAPGRIGALLAGPMIAAEGFKTVFRSRMPSVVMRDYILDPLSFGVDGPVFPTIELDNIKLDLAVLGCGSIGFGIVDAVTMLPGLSGRIVLVDNGTLEERNLYKYPRLDRAAARAGQSKVAALRLLLEKHQSQLCVEGRETNVSSLTSTPSRIAIASVDNIPARYACQELLTQDLINVAIAGTTLEVASLRFGQTGCIECLYADTPGQDYDAIAEITGIPPAVVEELWRTNRGLAAADLQVLADRPAFRSVDLTLYDGQPLSSLMRRLPYGETIVISASGAPVPISTAFVAAMAGTLAVIEALKLSSPELSEYRLKERLEWNMLGIFTPRAIVHVGQRTACFLCGSTARSAYFRELWG
jgi:ThiF family